MRLVDWLPPVLGVFCLVGLVLMASSIFIRSVARQSARRMDFTVSRSRREFIGLTKLFIPDYREIGQDPPHVLIAHGRSFEDGGVLYALKLGRGIFGRHGAQLRVIGYSYHSEPELLHARSTYLAALRKHFGWTWWRVWRFWPSAAERLAKGKRTDRLKRIDSPNRRPPAIDEPLEDNQLSFTFTASNYLVNAAIETAKEWKVTERRNQPDGMRRCIEAVSPGATSYYHLVEHEQGTTAPHGQVRIDARFKCGPADADAREEINRLAEAIRQSLAEHKRAEGLRD